jgi:hypothetical protein
LAVRREEALKINPETAEVEWEYACTMDPYGVLDEWELPEEFRLIGRAYFARAPGSAVWVAFRDLPQAVRSALRGGARPNNRQVQPAELEWLEWPFA